MANRKIDRKAIRKEGSLNVSKFLKRAEGELEKKKKELIQVKERHRKLAGEFIDRWVKVRRLKNNTDSTLV